MGKLPKPGTKVDYYSIEMGTWRRGTVACHWGKTTPQMAIIVDNNDGACKLRFPWDIRMPVKTISLQEIADAFNYPVDRIRLKL